MNLYNNKMKSQSTGEQYSLQSAEYNGSQSAFYNIFYNVSTIFLFPVSLLFCHIIREFFWFWELSACNGICLYLESCSGRNEVPSFGFGECDREVPLFGVTE